MKSAPLLMTPALVSACFAGNKTETRRVILPQPNPEWHHVGGFDFCTGGHLDFGTCCGDVKVKCRYGMPGDELWVKENHYRRGKWVKAGRSKGRYDSKAVWHSPKQKWRFKPVSEEVKFEDNAPEIVRLKKSDIGWRRRPSLFMRRQDSRLTLVLESVTVERVQDITEAAANSEGVKPLPSFDGDTFQFRTGFSSVWDHINGKRLGGSLKVSANPWVLVMRFHVKK